MYESALSLALAAGRRRGRGVLRGNRAPSDDHVLRPPRRFGHPLRSSSREAIDGAYDKMIVRGSGIDMPLRLLSPYQPFGMATFEACMQALRENYPDWLE